MKTTFARRAAALVACAGLGLAAPALAQDKTVKIGVLNDMSSLYADIGGPIQWSRSRWRSRTRAC